jgi:PAS domain S-box-containing protein
MNSPTLLEPNHRLLVIDDNQAIHEDLRKILTGEVKTQEHLQDDEELLFGKEATPIVRFEIDSAYQGQEGLAKLEQSLAAGRPYALAFVDIRMPPGWDGVETISRLWQAYADLQVVVCTAYSDYSWNDIQRRLGRSENLLILKKPFDNIEVIQLAHALTRKWLVSGQAQARLEDLDLMVARRTAELEAANQRINQQFEEKAAAEAAFRTVFESSPIGIALSDLNGRYVDVNRAMEELMGVPKADVCGRDPVDVGWIAGREAFDGMRRALDEGRGLDSHELVFWHPQQGERTGLLWARRVAIGSKGYWLSFVLDISERKRMEQDLVRARLGADAAAEAKSQFLANMSHEIRTPLNGILGLSLLLEEESLPDDLRSMTSLIRTSGEVLRRVLDDVLDFSKLESGKLQLVEEPFDLGACLQWSFELFRKTAAERNIACRLHLDHRLPARVSGDATRLRQVTANLMSNAVKFTHRGSVELEAQLVELAHGEGRHLIRVAVRDTGIGIPEDRIHRIFESFSQVDASTSRSYGGTGLGLAISKRLVEMMGGELRIRSREGEGTTLEFTFSAGIAAGAGPATEAADTAGTQGLKVLVAEDNKVNQLVTLRMLRKMGCQADLAHDGDSAVRSVETNSYDIVLMDLSMPGVDGLEATRRIRRMPAAQSSIPIVALTASASNEVRSGCLAAGMNDYLSKPMDVQALRRALDRWGRARTQRSAPG